MAKVSIGLPVHNGQRYLSEALSAIQRQTYTDWDLIICDNASTDNTEEIARHAAHDDRRIKYHRNTVNKGAGPNFNLAFELADGQYFKWAAHDDICAPEYFEKTVRILDHRPDIALCTTRIMCIDENGNHGGEREENLQDAESPFPSVRFRRLASLSHGCFDIFGLIRREVLEQTPRISSFIGSDRALLTEIGLYGRFFRIPEILFYSREHKDRSLRAYRFRERNQWWDVKLRGKHPLPWNRLLLEYVQMLSRAPLTTDERIRCFSTLPGWVRRNWRYIVGDVIPPLSPPPPQKVTTSRQAAGTPGEGALV